MSFYRRSSGVHRAVQAFRSGTSVANASRVGAIVSNTTFSLRVPVQPPQCAFAPSFSSMPSIGMTFASSVVDISGSSSGVVESSEEDGESGLTSGSESSADSVYSRKKRKAF
uniref:Uncharacterized protein n=1 Tax=Polytomella parva TaxID=51329 RepID=A0A7S0VMJ2_9CHLO|mmetsp:Transcript_7276/g.14365  ORF Transcript_7276/g.14365 Transcript_7276/m.14365 type:complete len:112 (+) Transcript_7276:27-362(+)